MFFSAHESIEQFFEKVEDSYFFAPLHPLEVMASDSFEMRIELRTCISPPTATHKNMLVSSQLHSSFINSHGFVMAFTAI